MIVKVTAPTGNQVQARVQTADGTLDMLVPADVVARRFANKNEPHGFFNASFDDGVLEIGERAKNEAW